MKFYPCDELDENLCGRSRRDPPPGSPGIVVAACPCVARGIDRHPRVAMITNVAKRCKGDGKRQCGAASQPHEWRDESNRYLIYKISVQRMKFIILPTLLSPYLHSTPFPKIIRYTSKKVLTIKTRRNGNLKTMETPPLCF